MSMSKLCLYLSSLTAPIVLWLGWSVWPELVSPPHLRYLCGVFVLLCIVSGSFISQSAALLRHPSLTCHEQDRLFDKVDSSQHRAFRTLILSVFYAAAAWCIGSIPVDADSPLPALAIGLLLVGALSELVVIGGWLRDIKDFVAEVKLRDARRTPAGL